MTPTNRRKGGPLAKPQARARRELVLQLLSEGQGNTEIAAACGITESAMEQFIRNLRRSASARNNVQLVADWLRGSVRAEFGAALEKMKAAIIHLEGRL